MNNNSMYVYWVKLIIYSCACLKQRYWHGVFTVNGFFSVSAISQRVGSIDVLRYIAKSILAHGSYSVTLNGEMRVLHRDLSSAVWSHFTSNLLRGSIFLLSKSGRPVTILVTLL